MIVAVVAASSGAEIVQENVGHVMGPRIMPDIKRVAQPLNIQVVLSWVAMSNRSHLLLILAILLFAGVMIYGAYH